MTRRLSRRVVKSMVGGYCEVFRAPIENGVLRLATPEVESTWPAVDDPSPGGARMIVIGLGTTRSGTASLAKLLSSQHDAICFHEINPSCVRFSGTPRPILNTIDGFQDHPRRRSVDADGRSVAEGIG
jgi:hypothetical protein